MSMTRIVRCPNCGKHAERYNCSENHLLRTSCSNCDYLMVQCSRTGKVIEAYAPGLTQHSVVFR